MHMNLFQIMKKLTIYLIIVLTAFLINKQATAQSANTSLSNLTSPAKINASLLPDKNNQHNLGSKSKSWENIYIDSAVYLNGVRFLSSPEDFQGYGVNTAVGANTFPDKTGSNNTATGNYALHNSHGNSNTAAGSFTLSSNDYGNYNTANGVYALNSNNSGYSNTAIGANALQDNSSGSANTAVGVYAMHTTNASSDNTAIGYVAGYNYNNGNNNVILGAGAELNDAGYYNNVAIGKFALCTDVNQVRIGNSSTVSIGGFTWWSNISDGRVKKNIKQNVPGLAFINKLQPVTYNFDLDAADKILQPPIRRDKDDKVIQLTTQELNSRTAKEQIIYTGFIAQDVEKTAKELNYCFSGIDAAKNDKDLYGLRYADFVVPLVKAVQETDKNQKSAFKTKNDVIAALQKENIKLKERLGKLETLLTATTGK